MNLPERGNRRGQGDGLSRREAVIEPLKLFEGDTAVNAIAVFVEEPLLPTRSHLAERDQLVGNRLFDLSDHHSSFEIFQHVFFKTNVRWPSNQVRGVVDFLLQL